VLPRRGAGGDAYEHAFDIAGVYDYSCLLHEGPGMTGAVVR